MEQSPSSEKLPLKISVKSNSASKASRGRDSKRKPKPKSVSISNSPNSSPTLSRNSFVSFQKNLYEDTLDKINGKDDAKPAANDDKRDRRGSEPFMFRKLSRGADFTESGTGSSDYSATEFSESSWEASVNEKDFGNSETRLQVKYKGLDKIWLATSDSLIGKLADNEYQDTDYIETFLHTYDYFVDPVLVLKMLINLYRSPLHQQDSGVADDRSRSVIQLRVINVLKKWIELRYSSLKENLQWREIMRQFDRLLKRKGTDLEKNWGDHIRLSIKTNNKILKDIKTCWDQLPSAPNPTKINLHTLDLDVLAEQMTLLDHEMFQSVKMDSYYKKAWEVGLATPRAQEASTSKAPPTPSTPSSSERTPIKAIIDHFNEVSGWVATEVVNAENRKARTNLISRFISLIEKLRNLRNFHGAMKIYSALNLSAVTRLKKTWKDLPSKSVTSYNIIQRQFTHDLNFKRYRELLENAETPGVPYQGLILADLTYIEELPDFVMDTHRFVNWDKMSQLSKVFSDIRRFRKSKYETLNRNETLLLQILKISVYYRILSEDALHRASLTAETLEKEDKDIGSMSDRSREDKSTPKRTPKLLRVKYQGKKHDRSFRSTPSFDSLLTDPHLYDEFYKYLQGTFNDENLLFYKEVSEFKNLDFSKISIVAKRAWKIFDTFVSESGSSDLQVCLTNETKKEVEQQMKRCENGCDHIASDIFAKAEVEIELLLKTSFSNFLEKH